MRLPVGLLRYGVAPVLAWAGCLALAGDCAAQVMRKDINTLKATDQVIVSYLKAVDAMQKLPATDPHNWTFQANIHAAMMNGTVDPTWDTCQHGSWFFLPWHRAYLWYFEKIVQKYSGDPTFALPYWNWTDPGARSLPALFRDDTTVLFDMNRDANVNDGSKTVTDAWVTTDYQTALNLTDFFTTDPTVAMNTFGGFAVGMPVHFQGNAGALELSPHNNIHTWFGPTSDMTDPTTAARDPAFWSHHAMIDKTWEDWLAQGGGRANPTGEAGWMNQTFQFYDENKNKVTIAVKDLLDTKKLGYIYVTPMKVICAGTAAATPPGYEEVGLRIQQPHQKKEKKGVNINDKKRYIVAEKEFAKPVALEKKPFTVALKIAAGEQARLARLLQQEISPIAFTLALDGVTFAALADPKRKKMISADSNIQVYLNAPADAKLDPKSPYYAGMTSFFGPLKDKTIGIGLSTHLEMQRKRGQLKAIDATQLRVTLVRVWFSSEPPAEIKTSLTFKGMRLVVLE